MLWQMQQYWSRQQAKRHWIIFIAGLVLLSIGLSCFNGIGQFDRVVVDLATRFDTREPSSDIVIITIDDDSAHKDALGRWPWPRQTHAELLEKLGQAKVKAVGMDILLDQQDQSGLKGDEALAQVLKKNHNVVLPFFVYIPAEGSGWIEVTLPLKEFSDSAKAIAHVNLHLDKDGKARSIYLREGRDGAAGGIWDHMALALARFGKPDNFDIPGRRASQNVIQTMGNVDKGIVDLHLTSPKWLRDYQMLISFAGPPNTFQRYSYIDVYSGAIPPEQLKDKYILIGVTGTGMGDAHSTPMTGKDVLMPGVEVIANILDGLLQEEYRYSATVLQNILYNILPILLAVPLFYFYPPRTIILGLIGLAIINLLAMFLVRRYIGIQVFPLASLICLMVSYPWWSWRRLELSMRQMKEEFIRMRRANGFFQAQKHTIGDRLERNIQEFNNAAWQLRDLQQMIRSSLDELPHAILITDEHTQAILCNTQSRKLFQTTPPLPTMAFEPAMGFEEEQQTDIPQHHFGTLLKEKFIHSLEQQSHENTYAKKLLDVIEKAVDLSPGSIELTDHKDGRRYLLKIVKRPVFNEQTQGWLISLVNISGAQYAENQRDQLLRYLFENVKPQLDVLVRQNYTPEQTQKNISFLASQTNAFLELEYAQMAIYFYEKMDISECIRNAIENLKFKHGLVNLNTDSLQLPENFFLQADINLFEKAIEELLLLLFKLQASNKIPLIKLKAIERETEDGIAEKVIQLYFIISTSDNHDFANKSAFFDIPVELMALPIDINPNTLYWWSARATMMRHGAQIKINRTPQAFGIIAEFPDKDDTQQPETTII